MDEYILRNEYEEYKKRQGEQDSRQNARIGELEETVKKINELTITVDRLANNMDGMLKQMERQSSRLDALEGRDGEMWRKVISYAITAAVGIFLGYLLKQIGIV